MNRIPRHPIFIEISSTSFQVDITIECVESRSTLSYLNPEFCKLTASAFLGRDIGTSSSRFISRFEWPSPLSSSQRPTHAHIKNDFAFWSVGRCSLNWSWNKGFYFVFDSLKGFGRKWIESGFFVRFRDFQIVSLFHARITAFERI